MSVVSLEGRRVLIVEDEYMIAQAVRRDLEREGAIVVGPVPSVGKALSLLEEEPQIDAAILDVNLGGENSFAIAETLQARAVPLLFATGYSASDVPPQWRHVGCVEKPFRPEHLARLLASASAA